MQHFNDFLALPLQVQAGILIYFLPLMICAIGYPIRGINMVRQDLKDRELREYYSPSITIGGLFWGLFVILCPILNLGAAVFDLLPIFCARFFGGIYRFCNTPLVPRKRKT